MKLVIFLVLCLVLCSSLGYSQEVKLRKKFYRDTCGDAEDIVKKITEEHVDKNPSLSAKLLRMHFHDCFVRGCDASILLSSTNGNTAERDAIPNLSLSGFDVIEDIKAKLEKKCPNTVSCADILTLATRDAVSHQYKFKEPVWEVLTGRRDGRVSIAAEVLQNIPSPFNNFAQLKKNFANKGLTVHDLVVLSGGHTIGVGHCNLFSARLYNFTGKGDQDPSLDPTYAKFLRSKCSPTDRVTSLEMDPGSGNKFDSNYFSALKQQKGMFVSDAALLTDKIASKTVGELVDPTDFFTEFAQSMERMARIEVLTGVTGEIRTRCSVINSK